jgi:hypothetical protein
MTIEGQFKFEKPRPPLRSEAKPSEALTSEEEAQRNRLEAQQNTEAVNTAAQAIENASEELFTETEEPFTELTIPEVEAGLWGGKQAEEVYKAEVPIPESVAARVTGEAGEERKLEARERERLIGDIRRIAENIFSKDVYGSQLFTMMSAVNYLLETVERKGLRNPRLRGNYFELLEQLSFHGERILESLQPGKKWQESENIENLKKINENLKNLSSNIEKAIISISSKAKEWEGMMSVGDIARDAVEGHIHQRFNREIEELLNNTKNISYMLLRFEELPERRIEVVPEIAPAVVEPTEKSFTELTIPEVEAELWGERPEAKTPAEEAPKTEEVPTGPGIKPETKTPTPEEPAQPEAAVKEEAEKLYNEIYSKIWKKLYEIEDTLYFNKIRLLRLGFEVKEKTGEYPKDIVVLEDIIRLISEDIDTFRENEKPAVEEAYGKSDIEKLKSLQRSHSDYLEKVSRKVEELDKRREELWHKYQSVLEEKPEAASEAEARTPEAGERKLTSEDLERARLIDELASIEEDISRVMFRAGLRISELNELTNEVFLKTGGKWPDDVMELRRRYNDVRSYIATYKRESWDKEFPEMKKKIEEQQISTETLREMRELIDFWRNYYLRDRERELDEIDKRFEELKAKYKSVLEGKQETGEVSVERKPSAPEAEAPEATEIVPKIPAAPIPEGKPAAPKEAKPEAKSPEERRLEMELRDKEQKLQNATYEDLKRGFGTYINLIDNEKIKKELLGILDTVSWQYAEEFISGQTENAVKNLRKFERETLPLAVGAALITSPNRNEMRNEIIRFFKDRPNILRKLQESQGELRVNLYETSFIYVRDKKEKRYKNEFVITIDEKSMEFLKGIQLDQKYLDERDKEIEEINKLLQQLSSKKSLIEKERNVLTELKNNLDVLKRSGVKKVTIEIGGQDREIGVDELEKRLPQIENSIKQMSNLLEAFSEREPFRFEGDNIEALREYKKTLTKVLRELEDLEKRRTLEEELRGKAEGKTGPESPQERAKELKNQTNRVKDLFNSVTRWTLYAGSTSFKALTGVGVVLAVSPFAIFKKAIEYFRKTKSPGAGLLKSIIGK